MAVLIALGKDWLPGSLGLRFGHVLASTATIAGLWYLLGKPRGNQLLLAAALVFAQPFFHVYGFIATPDGPLLLFTVLYLLAYRRFLRAPGLVSGALWGLTMAGLLYGKYHGVMLIFFTVLPWLGWLLRQPGAWVAALGGTALYLPHLYWQYTNDFPSFRYHLSGRDDAYQFKYTTEYLLNQLLIFSPLLVWWYGRMSYHYRSLFRPRPQVQSKDGTAMDPDRAFHRVNYWLIVGFLVFFLYTTTKGGTEAQWTALLSVPLCYLTYRWVTDERPDQAKWVRRMGFATLGILLLARVLLLLPRDWLPFAKPFDHEPWVQELAERADGLPVMVQNSYRFASLYEFYSGRPAWTFTDVQYRLNQYDLWTADSVYHNQPVYLLGQGSWERPSALPFRTQKRNMLTERIDSFQVLKNVRITGLDLPDTIVQRQLYDYTLTVSSPRVLHPDAGDLPLSLHVALHYAEEELLFWRLEPDAVTRNPFDPTELTYTGRFRTWGNTPPGPAEVELGLAYAGMPPLRGQSERAAVVIVSE